MTNNNLEWKKRFGEKFSSIGDGWISREEIESFISSLLTEQRQNIEEFIRGADNTLLGPQHREELIKAIRSLSNEEGV